MDDYIQKLEAALNAFDALTLAYVMTGVLDRANTQLYTEVREKHHEALTSAINSCISRNRTVPVKR